MNKLEIVVHEFHKMSNTINKSTKYLLVAISIGLCLYYTYWVVIMFVNFKYELTDIYCNTVMHKSHYGIIIQYITLAMFCVAILSLVNFWLSHFIHKNVNWKNLDITLSAIESAFMCGALFLIPFIKRDLASIAFSTEHLDYLGVGYFLLYVPYLAFVLVSYRYLKTQPKTADCQHNTQI